MVRILRTLSHAGPICQPQPGPLGLFLRHRQPFLSPKSLYPLMINFPSFLPEQRRDAPIAIPAILVSQDENPGAEALLVRGTCRAIVLRGPTLPHHSTGPALRHPQHASDRDHGLAASGRA
jgi:hypothetical protein